MTSHDRHDLGRLAELAASDPRGEEARAMVGACPECAEEFRLQLEALSHLDQVGLPELSDEERNSLREGIWSRLEGGHEEKPTPASAPTAPLTPRRSWYPKVVGLAAALVMVVGLGYVFTDMSGDSAGDAGAPATVAADSGGEESVDSLASESAADTETTAASADTTSTATDGGLGTAEVAGESADTTSAANTTMSAAAPTEASPAMDFDAETSTAVSDTVDRLRSSAVARSGNELILTSEEERCIEELAIDRILTVDSITAGDIRLSVVSRKGNPDVVVFDPTNCQEVPVR